MNEIKVFRDPIYGYVKVNDQMIWDLIQTKEFQRLRRIHQLGGTSMVYHTAEHSRFSHSLGVYEVARRIIYEVNQIRTELSKDERLITLSAALLHDLGHGPYSHAFEDVFGTDHEEYTVKILLGHTEVNHVLENYEPGFAQKVASIISKKCYHPQCPGDGCNHEIMINLISSQLDADRLDYLQRDAYNTGATYGEVDLDRIIRSILLVNKQIAYKYTSLHAIENYLMSRYHMYWQVYYHPVSISHEVLLMKIFARVKTLLAQKYDFKLDMLLIEKLINKSISLEEYLELDEVWLNYNIKQWTKESDPILKDLANRFINRKLFKHISCINQDELQRNYEILKTLLIKYNLDPAYYLHQDTLTKEAYHFYHQDLAGNWPILLKRRDELVEITEVSHIVKGMREVGTKVDYKLYYPEELRERLSETDLQLFQTINK